MVRGSSRDDSPDKMETLLQQFKEICGGAGLKVTHQRLEVFRALAQSHGHPSVEEVYEKVRQRLPMIALDTVYRTLALLEKHGVLSRIQLDSRARFDFNRAVHHHFVCTGCNRIEDFYWPSFDRTKPPGREAPWGRIDSKHVEIRGICPACLEQR